MISALLSPFTKYLYGFGFLAILIGGTFLVHHIEQIGEEKIKAADAKVVAAQELHKEEVEKRAEELIAIRNTGLHAALSAPVPTDALSVRVCINRPQSPIVNVRADGASERGSSGDTTTVPGAVPGQNQSEAVDIGPDVEGLFTKADAEIAYWRGYYSDCVKQGICKSPEVAAHAD